MTRPLSERDSHHPHPTVSIALPCFNEEGNVEETIRNLTAWLDADGVEGEIIAVDDGSTDRTRERLEALARSEPRLKIVVHPQNLGYGAAVRSGLDAGSAEWIAFMDSDGQFRAEDLARLLPVTEEADVVTGRRRERADPWGRRLLMRCFRAANRWLFGVRVDDINCAMKLIRRRVWPRIRPCVTTGALFNLEMFSRMKIHGVAWCQVDVEHYPRRAGAQTGAQPQVLLRAAREMLLLRLRLSMRPAGDGADRRRNRAAASLARGTG